MIMLRHSAKTMCLKKFLYPIPYFNTSEILNVPCDDLFQPPFFTVFFTNLSPQIMNQKIVLPQYLFILIPEDTLVFT